jgi:hypothetical protein
VLDALVTGRALPNHGLRPGTSSRARLLAALASFVLAACTPIVIRPPAVPRGFIAPPRATYTGVLSRAGALVAAASAGTADVSWAIEVEPLANGRALVHVGPACELPAAVTASPYVDMPGQGFMRQADGVLTIDGGASCSFDEGNVVTLATGSVALHANGYVDLSAAGAGGQGVPASLRFNGTLSGEREAATVAAPETTVVHLLAELVTPCQSCSVNHASIGTPGSFRFEPALERANATQSGPTWTPVCTAPCTARVDGQPRLRIGGLGIAESHPFTLPARSRVALKASGSGTGARVFGWAFVGAGALYVAIGTTALILGANAPRGTPQQSVRATGEEIFGVAFDAASLAFLIPGLVVLKHSGTTVTTDAGETLAAP